MVWPGPFYTGTSGLTGRSCKFDLFCLTLSTYLLDRLRAATTTKNHSGKCEMIKDEIKLDRNVLKKLSTD